jgi:hypothetical protein
VKKGSVIQLAGGAVLAAAGLWFFLKDVNPRQLLHDFQTTPLWAIGSVICLTFLTLWLRAVRWNLILPASPPASRKGLFGIVAIGFMINNILPARIGEAARVLLLWKRNGFSVAASAGSVLLERIIDSIMFLAFFFVPALLLPALRPLLPAALPLAAVCGAVVIVLILYAIFPSSVQSIAALSLKVAPVKLRPKIGIIGCELASNLHWISSPSKCLVMTVMSFLTVSCNIAMMVILVRENYFGFFAGMFASACAALGAAIPLSPGYVGTLHAVLKEGLVRCGVDANKAIVVATLYHAIGYTTVTVAGLYYYLRLRISFRDINRAKSELAEEEGKEECGRPEDSGQAAASSSQGNGVTQTEALKGR